MWSILAAGALGAAAVIVRMPDEMAGEVREIVEGQATIASAALAGMVTARIVSRKRAGDRPELEARRSDGQGELLEAIRDSNVKIAASLRRPSIRALSIR